MRTRDRSHHPLFFAVALVFGLSGCRSSEIEGKENGGGDRGSDDRLSANDVSVLMPLPASQEARAHHIYLLPAAGETPTVFPEGLESELPSLFSTSPGPESALYRSMLVTAFRFDPCFPAIDDEDPESCQAQVRLGAQLVEVSPQGTLTFDEVALHLFYDLTPVEASQLATELFVLKQSSPVVTTGKPLFVHPALEGPEGMGSAWGQELKTTVLKYARPERLNRVTGIGFVFDSWPFFAVKVAGGRVVERETLLHLDTTDAEPITQSWDIFGDDVLLGNISPSSNVEQGPPFLLDRANYVQPDGTVQEGPALRAAVDSVERILNPKRHTPQSVDCVSCHVARIARADGASLGVSFASDDSYVAPDGANVDERTDSRVAGAGGNIVQFGYFLRSSANHGLPPPGDPLPSVGPRVIYESIEAARFTSQMLLPSER